MLRRADVAARLASIAHDNGLVAANRARAALSASFSWAIGEGLTDVNPVIGTNKACDEISRDRVLSDEELRLIWRHVGEGEYGAIVRLLMLTGQRREEVGGMRWSELSLAKGVWAIDASRTKNQRPHVVHLSTPAVEILQAQGQRGGRGLVFGAGAGPFQGWANAKKALDTRMQKALGETCGKRLMQPWRLHDLRRTAATRMADLGVQPHLIEATLNHISGHKSGVAGIYNRASYEPEKRAALDLWANCVISLVEDRPSNVALLHRAG